MKQKTNNYENLYDVRQLHLMFLKIKLFRNGNISIGNLINSLEALINTLQRRDNEWDKEYISHWFNLEQIYAVALYEERDLLDDNDIRIVIEESDALIDLITKRLSQEYIPECRFCGMKPSIEKWTGVPTKCPSCNIEIEED